MKILWFLLALLLRFEVALFPHSGIYINFIYKGQGIGPLYGDFEAQRHFMETTFNLPIKQWYRYDLTYWGLDYPPLTAYHSQLIGYIANQFNSSWMALETSRGNESPNLKIFMRWSVIISDVLVYFTAVSIFFSSDQMVLISLLFSPGLVLIDHGHFQYNSVMLGLSLVSFGFLIRQRYLLASVFYCLSLGFKHMALYYSLAFFFCLLGICWQRKSVSLLIQLGAVVLLTFGIQLYPFYHYDGIDGVLQIFRRLFPFERGLYEDKVANFWCAISILIKLKKLFSLQQLMTISSLVTLLACLPASLRLFFSPTPRNFIYGTACISLSFFLFSFQVHEKSILIPVLPISLLITQHLEFVEFFVNMSMFSMFPLFQKDDLVVAYVGLLLIWNGLLDFQSWRFKPGNHYIYLLTYTGCIVVHLLDAFIEPPQKLPHLFIVMNVLVSCCGFLYSLLFLYQQLFSKVKQK